MVSCWVCEVELEFRKEGGEAGTTESLAGWVKGEVGKWMRNAERGELVTHG